MDPVSNPERLGFDRGRLGRIRDWMQRYVDQGRFPGAATLIARQGEIAYLAWTGQRDIEKRLPWQQDTLARIFSMTKPVTSVALMMLYEQGLVHLEDPVDSFLPELKSRHVLIRGARSLEETAPAQTRMTLRHLLTHTSGFTYGMNGGVLGEIYARERLGVNFAGGGLAALVTRLGQLPLDVEPGTRWHYGVSTDVLGRVVEVVSGKTLEAFFQESILGPLGMNDTAFSVPDGKTDRFASLYMRTPQALMQLIEDGQGSAQRAGKVDTFLGGAGLVSTITDYWRFAEMLRGGGVFRGARLLAPRTVRLMASNHLPGDIASMGPATWSETSFEGVGFGLCGLVILDPAKAQASASVGDFGWGGMASTVFWVSPADDLVVVFLTQLMPSDAHPNRKELRALVHQALVDR